jgi:arylsulfatase A-like enzyme
MAKPFKGTINVDIRDSDPDWTPFEPPVAPYGAPNVLYIVLDDVGFSAMSCYGGPIETPNIDRIADQGVRYTQWHTTAQCSPTRSCLLTGRNHTRNSMACITEAAIGFPNGSGTIPPENGMLSEILVERGWNTYITGKWHLCPEAEMNVASPRRNYYAPGACHAPHHAPQEWIAKFRGRFDMATRRSASRPWPGRRSWASSRRRPTFRRSTRLARWSRTPTRPSR